jgi:hypothetical protein
MGYKTGRLVQTLALQRQMAQVKLNVSAYQGEVALGVNADLKPAGTAYGLGLKVAGVKFDDLVNDYIASNPKKESLKQLKGKVTGALDMNASGTGRGLNARAIKRQLNLAGHFKLAKGRLSKLEMQEKIAGVIPHPPTAAVFRQDITFDRLETDYTMKGGRVAWPNLIIDTGGDGRGGNLMIEGKGWHQLGADIDMHVVPHFNPSIVKLEGALQDAFGDDKGWATYDSIAYYGPSTKKAKADFSQGVKKAATKVINKQVDAAKQKAKEEAQKKAQEVIQQQGGELIKQLPGGLNNLFGK